MLPKYPVYIPSKGRPASLTARCLRADGVPFKLVVEPQDFDAYAENFGADDILVLPFANLGQGSIPARNWIKEHSISIGAERHWQLDDNIRTFHRRYAGKRLPVNSGIALSVVEQFTDRYQNIAISGLQYTMFMLEGRKMPPYFLNSKVYSMTLVNNAIPNKWRGRYNEDTDLCLQVLADGWCTVVINAFMGQKTATMTMKGGNSDQLYKGNGRLAMAKELERNWPGIVTTRVRFGRPQHVVKDSWKCFKTPLIPKQGIDLSSLPDVDELGMRLVQKKPIESANIQRLFNEYNSAND